MKQIGVRFLFETGGFFQVVMSESEATNLIHSWKHSNVRGKILGDASQWAVDLEKAVAIHTVPLEQLIQQSQQQVPQVQQSQQVHGPLAPWLKGSGLN